MKKQIILFYQNHKEIHSPLFGIVKVTPQSLWHLENRDKKHKRTLEESKMRYKCFMLIDKIIQKSHLYQEYKQETQEVVIKKKGKKIKKSLKVKYFGLVGIVEAYEGHWVRVKVIIKRTANRNKYEFVSVIPAWNIKGYHRLYFGLIKNFVWLFSKKFIY